MLALRFARCMFLEEKNILEVSEHCEHTVRCCARESTTNVYSPVDIQLGPQILFFFTQTAYLIAILSTLTRAHVHSLAST